MAADTTDAVDEEQPTTDAALAAAARTGDRFDWDHHDDSITLRDAIEDAEGQRQRALVRVAEALLDAPDHYYAVVSEDVHDDGKTKVVITTDDEWFNEGEVGDTTIRLFIGPNGGAACGKTARWVRKDEFTGSEYRLDTNTKVARMWKKVERALDRAS